MATGKYSLFAEQLVASARQFFFTQDKVLYYIFTDQTLQHPAQDIIVVPQKKLGWPYDTLMRSHIYEQHKEKLFKCDYIFAMDADMLFVDQVGREILSERVGTLQPGYIHKKEKPYENRRASTAYINSRPRGSKHYYAGGFYGGKRNDFFSMISTINKNIDIDLKKNLIATWHDESHLNKFFLDNPPTLTLSPSYCYPQSLGMTYAKKIIALNKNHAAWRA